MITDNCEQIKQILDKLQVNKLACQTKFSMRRARKIDASSLVTSFFLMMLQSQFSFRLWASNICILTGSKVSFQAVTKKLDYRKVFFFQSLFRRALQFMMREKLDHEVHEVLKPFHKVLVEDSTCFNLSKKLIEFFPGPRMPQGKVAMGRLQLRIELKSNSYQAISFKSFCRNDQSFSANILKVLKKGELVIRDLGYWSVEVFRKINARGAFFLSRLHLGVMVISPDTQEIIDLVSLLKSKERQGLSQVEMSVLLTNKHKVPVRLVAIKLSHKQAQKRLKMSASSRHRSNRISPEKLYLRTWNLYVTNVSYEIWPTHSVFQVYSLRWHIEMIFKCWKSKFKFEEFFKHCPGRNPVKPEIFLLLTLTWLVLFYIPKFNHYANAVWRKCSGILSPMKFADHMKSIFHLMSQPVDNDLVPFLAYYSCYSKRKDRLNHFEKTYMTFLS